MNELTSRFINELIKKLQEQFSHDVCMRYLEKTVSHSKIFFDDVIKELDEMKERTAEKIEGQNQFIIFIILLFGKTNHFEHFFCFCLFRFKK